MALSLLYSILTHSLAPVEHFERKTMTDIDNFPSFNQERLYTVLVKEP